ncbi:hypothetical protein SERLADRAFT_459497 [Serpula lacrymans var. lacrymans S7.9]|uniref:Uncharacterized protein n=1 Tax=Serpula lacrymans var. lacrymans (strain S7.9) TaxID=578457 RepID=F8NK58_SERL9|nr:uncharacterized protein SERLADRAFT_459497 [Serpula lacrymans var. lacrymans S7.9]EGO28742.1 hypothetical protein SERLADRAFT_459497 [Serpula lacrymans var. lacrymans S7.9]
MTCVNQEICNILSEAEAGRLLIVVKSAQPGYHLTVHHEMQVRSYLIIAQSNGMMVVFTGTTLAYDSVRFIWLLSV